jgi:exonuclease 1
MYLKKKVHAVITEDSDLLAFGVKICFFKMDKNGQGFEVDLDNLHLVEELNFRKFDLESLLITCILSGCDYLDSIKGIGFKKAHKLVYENGKDLSTLIKKIRREGKHLVPLDYEKTFERALLTFKFQRVYCPDKRQLVYLNDPETHEHGHMLKKYDDLSFLGSELDFETLIKVA